MTYLMTTVLLHQEMGCCLGDFTDMTLRIKTKVVHPQHVTIKETGFFYVTHGRNILQSANTFARKTGQDEYLVSR